jgi:predicted metal-dependent HD superfamily phosphohydrolase
MLSALTHRFDALRARYAEPTRAYHGQRHIDLLLALHAETRPHLHAPDAVELAIWYHDAIYIPLSPENERASAALLRTDMQGLLDPALIEAAASLVLATRSHEVPPGLAPAIAGDCAWFLDMDLSILGADPETFAWYDAAIRQEYAAVPDAEWRLRRPRVLGTFLARPRLYLTDHFHTRLDTPARANLRAAIAAATGEGTP